MGFNDYKKEIERKKEENRTLGMLEQKIGIFSERKNEYAILAKEALKRGDESAYASVSIILKNIAFQLAQAQDMLVNFKVARDMREMNSLNLQFTRAMDKIMNTLNNTNKQVNFKKTKVGVQKTLYSQNKAAQQLCDLLSCNGIAFAKTVQSISDIKDEDIRRALENEIKVEECQTDSFLTELENVYTKQEIEKENDSVYSAENQISIAVGKDTDNEKILQLEEDSDKKEIAKVFKKGEDAKGKTFKQPEDVILSTNAGDAGEFKFEWDRLPNITFEDVAGLDTVKETVQAKVLLPLKNPEAFEGYAKKNGGGLLLYGPPGTGKTMVAAAIANEIGAKFCAVQPSDLLHQGIGQSEKAVKALFAQARQYPCSVIYFDEMDAITSKNMRSQYAKHLRSELLAQIQGMESYQETNDRILFLIAATNRPWDIDSAFIRPGRFGTRIYVGLPDADARHYMLKHRLEKLNTQGIVQISDDVDLNSLITRTEGFNGADISNLMNMVEEISALRSIKVGKKYIEMLDFEKAFERVTSSVQRADIEKLMNWKEENG